jgi:3-hydroxyisobutyrate dehydrogenase
MVMNLLVAGFSAIGLQSHRSAGHWSEQPASSLQESNGNLWRVLTMLSNDGCQRSLINGLLFKTNSGKTINNMSTVAPETSRYLKYYLQPT